MANTWRFFIGALRFFRRSSKQESPVKHRRLGWNAGGQLLSREHVLLGREAGTLFPLGDRAAEANPPSGTRPVQRPRSQRPSPLQLKLLKQAALFIELYRARHGVAPAVIYAPEHYRETGYSHVGGIPVVYSPLGGLPTGDSWL